MNRDFRQTVWDRQLEEDWQAILRLAVQEDLGRAGDWTTRALVPEHTVGRAAIVARESGAIAGLPAVGATFREIEPLLNWTPAVDDGHRVAAGDVLGQLEGPARGLLSGERLALNLLGHLSGIATLTRAYVEAVAGTGARIYDTRKT
ncbi:MAG: nicotinate-nucleotide diphosphorylase (carboxylating), partial [Candidatus Nealsonbacteria bacterium]|nr:nicotinate-nucleotide diphosphorylase (carboxylating) [Candidatus Nealsonbacteria bacterium]